MGQRCFVCRTLGCCAFTNNIFFGIGFAAIHVYQVPFEDREFLIRELHGGLLKAGYRRVTSEDGAAGRESVEQNYAFIVTMTVAVAELGGFSPAQ